MDFRLGGKEADSKYILKVEPKVFAIRFHVNVKKEEGRRRKERVKI